MGIDDIIIYAVLLGSVFVFGGAAVLALSWAVRSATGSLKILSASAQSIFDPDEPIGQPTDYFPDAGAGSVPFPLDATQREFPSLRGLFDVLPSPLCGDGQGESGR